jgi:hypothetical protein
MSPADLQQSNRGAGTDPAKACARSSRKEL